MMENTKCQIMSYCIYFKKLVFEFVWCCIKQPEIWLLVFVMVFYLLITLLYLTCVCRFINVLIVLLSYTFIFVISLKLPFVGNFCSNHIKVVQHQPVKYELYPLSPLSRHRLSMVKRKVLVLDLDETLIHSHHDTNTRQLNKTATPPDFVLKVVIERNPVRFFVHKRPHVDFFLDIVSQWYELVVFTASMEIYGAGVADKLDNNRGILRRRYYRQHCTPDLGTYTKDLSAVTADLSSVFILDNSPGAYRSYPDNAIPIKSWFADPMDTALLNLLPVLDALRFTQDVRSVLSRNLHLHKIW